MSNPQNMEALKLANTVRVDAAIVKREVASGALTIAEAMEDPRAGGVAIAQLLVAQRNWGPATASRLLNRLMIWPTRHVRDLTDRQRQLIAKALEG